MPKPKKPKHPQTKLLLHNNSEIQVDHEIQELIQILNTPGLTTLNSCQNDRGTGYIQFRGKNPKSIHALPPNSMAKRKTPQTPTPHLLRQSQKSQTPKQFPNPLESHRLRFCGAVRAQVVVWRSLELTGWGTGRSIKKCIIMHVERRFWQKSAL